MTFKILAAARIEAMSKTKAEAESRIGALDDVFAEHVMKIYIFNKSTYVKGWCKELETWHTTISRLGNNLKGGKKLKYANYMDCLSSPALLEPAYSLKVISDSIIRHNPRIKPREDLDMQTMHKALVLFYTDLCNSMAAYIPWVDIESKLLNYLGAKV